jgi:hypothetical protein
LKCIKTIDKTTILDTKDVFKKVANKELRVSMNVENKVSAIKFRLGRFFFKIDTVIIILVQNNVISNCINNYFNC